MAFSPAPSLDGIINNSEQNLYTLYNDPSNVNFLAKLSAWRLAFFPLLDKDDPDQAKIHQWIVPTLAMEQEFASGNDITWAQVRNIVSLLEYQTSALIADGFSPSVPLENSILSAYNSIWAAL